MSDLIDRQAAIDAVTDELDMIDHVPQWVFNRLEKRLKQLPLAQPEPCEDAVSRKAVRYLLAHFVDEDKYVDACDGLKHLPPVTPKQRTGKWIDGIIPNDSGGLPVIVCDQCNTFFPLQFGDGHNFCPNCGAKMMPRND